MTPRARQARLLTREIGDELAVYDEDRDRLHVLNRTAALVWRHCDGQRTVADLAALVSRELGSPAGEHVVWLALARLQRAHLLEARVAAPGVASASRRALLRGAAQTAAGALLLPSVTSLTAPTAALAQSPPSL